MQDPPQPLTPYLTSALDAASALERMAMHHGTDTTTLRHIRDAVFSLLLARDPID